MFKIIMMSCAFFVFAIIGIIEGILLFIFKAEIFDYNSELDFYTIAHRMKKNKIISYLKDKREAHKEAPLPTKVWRFFSMILGTTLGWILLWTLLDRRLKYFNSMKLGWEDFALFILAYIGISGRLPTIPESVQQWFRR